MSKPRILNYIRKQLTVAAELMRDYATDNNSGESHPRRPTQLVIRKAVDDFLKGESNSHRWWIMPGLRGVGKTTLLAQTCLQLVDDISAGVKAQLLYLSLDEAVAAGFNLAEILDVYQSEILGNYFEKLNTPLFIFIDETQVDANWALTLKTIYDRSCHIFIFCTGSSALNLQVDANVAGRRARVETLHPLNFSEFQLLAHKKPINIELQQQLAESLYTSAEAVEVYEQLKKLRPQVNQYFTDLKPNSLFSYLDYGTLPFNLNRDQPFFYRDIRATVNKILDTDLRDWQNFSADSLAVMPNLLTTLSLVGDVVSLPKLSQVLGVSRPQLSQMLDVLVKAELLIRVPADGGGPLNNSRRPVKYVFTSAAVRAAYFDLTGDQNIEQQRRGLLLEDIAGLHYYRKFVTTGRGRLSYFYQRGGKRQCDFILRVGNQKVIPLEFGLGDKTVQQVIPAMLRLKCPYGLIFSQSELSIDRDHNIIKVPLDYFLLL